MLRIPADEMVSLCSRQLQASAAVRPVPNIAGRGGGRVDMGRNPFRPDRIAQTAIDIALVPPVSAGLVQVALVNPCRRLQPLRLDMLLPSFDCGHRQNEEGAQAREESQECRNASPQNPRFRDTCSDCEDSVRGQFLKSFRETSPRRRRPFDRPRRGAQRNSLVPAHPAGP